MSGNESYFPVQQFGVFFPQNCHVLICVKVTDSGIVLVGYDHSASGLLAAETDLSKLVSLAEAVHTIKFEDQRALFKKLLILYVPFKIYSSKNELSLLTQ